MSLWGRGYMRKEREKKENNKTKREKMKKCGK
jgi:hypothetical protein